MKWKITLILMAIGICLTISGCVSPQPTPTPTPTPIPTQELILPSENLPTNFKIEDYHPSNHYSELWFSCPESFYPGYVSLLSKIAISIDGDGSMYNAAESGMKERYRYCKTTWTDCSVGLYHDVIYLSNGEAVPVLVYKQDNIMTRAHTSPPDLRQSNTEYLAKMNNYTIQLSGSRYYYNVTGQSATEQALHEYEELNS